MNISSKISEISQAKKRRAALIFHSRRIEGIDVQPQNWVDTINLVKALFKELKKRRFGIDINHWGEIVLTEPERHIQVFLTAHQRLKPGIVEDIKNRLSHADYLIADEIYKARPVQLEFLANRLHAKRHTLKCSLQAELFNQDFCEMADQIMNGESLVFLTFPPKYMPLTHLTHTQQKSGQARFFNHNLIRRATLVSVTFGFNLKGQDPIICLD